MSARRPCSPSHSQPGRSHARDPTRASGRGNRLRPGGEDGSSDREREILPLTPPASGLRSRNWGARKTPKLTDRDRRKTAVLAPVMSVPPFPAGLPSYGPVRPSPAGFGPRGGRRSTPRQAKRSPPIASWPQAAGGTVINRERKTFRSRPTRARRGLPRLAAELVDLLERLRGPAARNPDALDELRQRRAARRLAAVAETNDRPRVRAH